MHPLRGANGVAQRRSRGEGWQLQSVCAEAVGVGLCQRWRCECVVRWTVWQSDVERLALRVDERRSVSGDVRAGERGAAQSWAPGRLI